MTQHILYGCSEKAKLDETFKASTTLTDIVHWKLTVSVFTLDAEIHRGQIAPSTW